MFAKPSVSVCGMTCTFPSRSRATIPAFSLTYSTPGWASKAIWTAGSVGVVPVNPPGLTAVVMVPDRSTFLTRFSSGSLRYRSPRSGSKASCQMPPSLASVAGPPSPVLPISPVPAKHSPLPSGRMRTTRCWS